MNWDDFKNLIINNLSDDLLLSKYKKLKSNQKIDKTFGHCYVASEVAYHLLGGKEEGWMPYFLNHLGYHHWFLKHKSGAILDLTSDQFKSPLDYNKAIGKGFLTKAPSKRAKQLIKKISESLI